MVILALPLLLMMMLFVVLPAKVFGDVGQRCNVFGFCYGSNVYCDKSKTCKCKDDYPIVLNPHKCLAKKRFEQRCEDPRQCSAYDPNSYCTQIPYQSLCYCLDEYEYNVKEEKCLKRSRKTEKPNLTLPLAVVISLAFSCMLCCCMVLLHLYRRNIGIFSNSRATRVQIGDLPATNDNTTNLLQNPADPLPSYEAATSLECVETQADLIPESDCPPSYDDVMKGSVIKESDVKETPT